MKRRSLLKLLNQKRKEGRAVQPSLPATTEEKGSESPSQNAANAPSDGGMGKTIISKIGQEKPDLPAWAQKPDDEAPEPPVAATAGSRPPASDATMGKTIAGKMQEDRSALPSWARGGSENTDSTTPSDAPTPVKRQGSEPTAAEAAEASAAADAKESTINNLLAHEDQSLPDWARTKAPGAAADGAQHKWGKPQSPFNAASESEADPKSGTSADGLPAWARNAAEASAAAGNASATTKTAASTAKETESQGEFLSTQELLDVKDLRDGGAAASGSAVPIAQQVAAQSRGASPKSAAVGKRAGARGGFNPLTRSYSGDMVERIKSDPVSHLRLLGDQIRESLKILMPVVQAGRTMRRNTLVANLSLESIDESDAKGSDADAGASDAASPTNVRESMDAMAIENEIGGIMGMLQSTIGVEGLVRSSISDPRLSQAGSMRAATRGQSIVAQSSATSVSSIMPEKEEILKSVSGVMESAMESALDKYSDKLLRMLTTKMERSMSQSSDSFAGTKTEDSKSASKGPIGQPEENEGAPAASS